MNKQPDIYYIATAFDQNGNFSSVESNGTLKDMVSFISDGWGGLVDVFQFERRADGTYSATDANEIVALAWCNVNADWITSGGAIPDFVHEHAPHNLVYMLADEPERPEREEHGTLHFGGSGVL